MERQAQPLQDQRILVVEDEYLVARGLCDFLEEAGAVVLGPVGWIGDALDLIERNKTSLDGAVLDIDLHGEKSYAVADALARYGIRVVLTTGYSTVAEAYQHYPCCQKPLDRSSLLAALAPGRGHKQIEAR